MVSGLCLLTCVPLLQIIFIDEIDAIAPSRGQNSSHSPVSARLVTTLLSELDGIRGKRDGVSTLCKHIY